MRASICRLSRACAVHFLAFALLVAAITGPSLLAAAQAGAGRILGNIDGTSHDGEQTYVSGWACQQGQRASIKVRAFMGNPAGVPSTRKLVASAWANLENEPAVGRACSDPGDGAHRFLILVPTDLFAHGGEKLYVNGIRVVDGVPNDAIAGSGATLKNLPFLAVPHPSVPALSGAYRGLSSHPRVFATASDIDDLVSRINRPGSYSEQRFRLLTEQIGRDLRSSIDWDAAYSGCRVKTYLLAFSYEPQEPGFLATLRADTNVRPGSAPPAGAAVVAARAALYAALVKSGRQNSAGLTRQGRRCGPWEAHPSRMGRSWTSQRARCVSIPGVIQLRR